VGRRFRRATQPNLPPNWRTTTASVSSNAALSLPASTPQPWTMADTGWGGLDVGAKDGYSALVTFGQDGSHPKVEVYFSTDVR